MEFGEALAGAMNRRLGGWAERSETHRLDGCNDGFRYALPILPTVCSSNLHRPQRLEMAAPVQPGEQYEARHGD